MTDKQTDRHTDRQVEQLRTGQAPHSSSTVANTTLPLPHAKCNAVLPCSLRASRILRHEATSRRRKTGHHSGLVLSLSCVAAATWRIVALPGLSRFLVLYCKGPKPSFASSLSSSVRHSSQSLSLRSWTRSAGLSSSSGLMQTSAGTSSSEMSSSTPLPSTFSKQGRARTRSGASTTSQPLVLNPEARCCKRW